MKEKLNYNMSVKFDKFMKKNIKKNLDFRLSGDFFERRKMATLRAATEKF